MALDLSRGHPLLRTWIAAALVGGCGLTHLDLNGGAHVTSARIASGSDIMLAIDATQPLALTLVYDDGFEESAPGSDVSWMVADSQIAAVDGGSQLRGRGRGATPLTATYRDQVATAMIEVSDQPQALEVQASDRNCAVGEHLQYGLLLRYQHGTTELVTATAAWTSDQPAIASIEAGTITGRAVGDTQVHASYGSLTTNADVHVSAAAAVQIDVAPTMLQLTIGATAPLHATATFSDGNKLDATTLVQWKSSLPAAASVGADGVVRALAPGKVTIAATRDAAIGTMALTVVAAP